MEGVYEKKDGAAVLLSWEGGPLAEIPDTWEGLPVTAVAPGAFQGSRTVETVLLPDTVKTVGERAFEGCRALTRAVLGDGTEELGDWCFARCGALQHLRLPRTLRRVGSYCFADCASLPALTLPDAFETAGVCVLQYCTALSFLSLPEGRCLARLLADQDRLVEVELRRSGRTAARLLFPEYLVEANAFTQFKEFRTTVYGPGERCRACVSAAGVDYPKYDAVFSRVVAEESESVALRYAFDRLRWPDGLGAAARESYGAFLRAHLAALLEEIFRGDEEEPLRFLLEGDYLAGRMDEAQALASRRGNARLGALLLTAGPEEARFAL